MVGVGIDIDERKHLEALDAGDVAAARDRGARQRPAGGRAHRPARELALGSETNTVTLSAEMARMLASERTMSGVEFVDTLQRAAHPDDGPGSARAADEALRSRRRRYVMECRLVVDGDIRQMVHRGEILLDDANKLVAVRGTFQDVTEQRAAETALLAARERLARERRAVRSSRRR